MALRRPITLSKEGGHSTPMEWGYEASGQSFKAGCVITGVAGQLTEDASDPDDIVGLTEAPAEGVENTKIPITPWRPGTIIEATIDDTSGGEAAGTYAAAVADVYGKFGLAKDTSSGIYYVDQDETSTVAVQLRYFKDPIGTLQPRAVFEVLPARLISA